MTGSLWGKQKADEVVFVTGQRADRTCCLPKKSVPNVDVKPVSPHPQAAVYISRGSKPMQGSVPSTLATIVIVIYKKWVNFK